MTKAPGASGGSDADPATEGVLDPVAVRHAAVPGRLRVAVAGLKRNPPLARRIEAALASRPEVEAAEARPRTGSVVVHYRPDAAPEALIATIAELAPAAGAAGKAAPAGDARPPPRPTAPDQANAPPWHAVELDAAAARLGTSPDEGLSEAEAAARLGRDGPNAEPEAAGRSDLQILADQVASLPVGLLLASAGISVATGGLADAVAILAVVGINAAIGYGTENQAERTIRSLGRLAPPEAELRRAGRLRQVDAAEVVCGDVLDLRPGMLVAADGRVSRAQGLTVDESALTGESMPVAKEVAAMARADVPLAERRSVVFKGTTVTGGSGRAMVVATGSRTELGRIQALSGTARAPETPMQRQLDRLGRQLVLASIATCGLVFAFGLARGLGLVPMLKSAVSLAVAALPEGLPTLATTTLALGIRDMRRHNVLVRRLDAVETLGSVGVVCFDKTGTLTENRLTAVAVETAGGSYRIDPERGPGRLLDTAHARELRALLEAAVLCNEATVELEPSPPRYSGSATESALLALAVDAGIDPHALRDAWPIRRTDYRTETHKHMTTHHAGGRVVVKGSPEQVLGMCESVRTRAGVVPLGNQARRRIERENARLAGRGLRVLGFADGDESSGLRWCGLIGLADPTRTGMAELMARFHRAGVKTVMITGDQSGTAYALAREIDLTQGRPVEILDGLQIDHSDPGVIAALADRTDVFARVSPANKLRIVEALQRAGRVVAMTGDGINDGPALRAADIGVAMGSGTPAAHEVADIVLGDDRLETMSVALGEGRTIYRNIRKAILYLLSTNASELMVMIAGTAAGSGAPLSPAQLLWINLVTDVAPGLALALEPAEPEVMEQRPRDPSEPMLHGRDFRRVAREGAVIATAAFAARSLAVLRSGPERGAGGTGFMALTLAQLLHALSCRSPGHGPFVGSRLPRSNLLLGTVGGLAAVQLLAAALPWTRRLLGLDRIDGLDLTIAGGAAACSYLANEALKAALAPEGDDHA